MAGILSDVRMSSANRSYCPMDGFHGRSFVRWTDNARRILSGVRLTSAFCVSDVESACCAQGSFGRAQKRVGGQVQVVIRLRLCFSSTFESGVRIMVQ